MNDAFKKNAKKYLDNYAEVEASQIIEDFSFAELKGSFSHALVVPAYNENTAFISRWLARPFENALFILVINQPCHDNITDNNHTLLRFLLDEGQLIHQKESIIFIALNDKKILVVDRFSTEQRRIPSKQGVGLARKIGCDIAAQLWLRQHIETDILHTSDADVTLPLDYFSRTKAKTSASACIYPFVHFNEAIDNSDGVAEATQIYEQSLQHYVAGLTFAGSPYAYHTIGSCIAVSIPHYCQARGFPKKNGGEDFYLLNKLAKLAPIISLSGEPLKIAARLSNRAPFGTGPSVDKILQLDTPMSFCAYDPDIFLELKALLIAISAIPTLADEKQFKTWHQSLSTANRWAVEQLKFYSLWQHISKQQLSSDQALKHVHWWFDGFRTLKYVHELQREFYHAMPINDAISKANRLYNT